VLIAGLERHQLEPMVEIADVAALPEVTLYPLPDQIADKVAAMVERPGPGVGPRHGTATWWTWSWSCAAARSTRPWPAPSSSWTLGYRTAVGDSTVAAELRTLDAALAAAGGCVNALLDGTVTHGTWDPSGQQWRP